MAAKITIQQTLCYTIVLPEFEDANAFDQWMESLETHEFYEWVDEQLIKREESDPLPDHVETDVFDENGILIS